jgi:polar amino acid transport system substrate-binding protein
MPQKQTAKPPAKFRDAVPVMLVLCAFALTTLAALPRWGECGDRAIIMATEEWPPFRMNDPNSPSGFRGIDIDIAERLSDAIGIPIVVQRHPWARALALMRTGGADMITGVARTQEREAFMHYVPISYYAVHPVFYARKERGDAIQTYADLVDGPSVGYSLHSAYFEPFNSDDRIKKVGLSTEPQLLHALALGRIDVIIGTDPNISFDIARLGYRDALEPTRYQPPKKTELFIALSRKSPAMAHAKKIEQALKRLLANATIEAIFGNYR